MTDQVVILDVGANIGNFCIPLAKKNPTAKLIAVEPIQSLAYLIQEKCSTLGLTNVQVLNYAVSKINEDVVLNLSGGENFNSSSLRSSTTFGPAIDRQISVKARRLDQLLGPLPIRFLKIDAQGLDVECLESLGEGIRLVDAGMLEVSSTSIEKSYEGEKWLLDALVFLDANGFEIYRITPNDIASREMNVFFVRKGLSFREIENELGLGANSIYAVGRYWHVPSRSPITTKRQWLKAILSRLASREL
jgi:FkbM family methyltransferase